MVNQINKPFAIYLLDSLLDIPKYFYVLSNLTGCLFEFTKLSHTGYIYHIKYVLNQKFEKHVSKKFLRPKSWC